MKENNWHAHHHSSVLFRGRTENSPVIHTHKKLNDLQKILYIYTIFFLLKIETYHVKVIGDGLFRVNPSKVLIQWRQLNLVPRFPLHFSANKCKKLVFSAREARQGQGRALAVGGGEVVLLFSDSDKTLRIKYVFSMFCFPIYRTSEQKSSIVSSHFHININCHISIAICLHTGTYNWTQQSSNGR